MKAMGFELALLVFGGMALAIPSSRAACVYYTDQPPGAAGTVVSLAPDGKIVVAGTFESIGAVTALDLQPDRRILVGGGFNAIAGQPRWGIARLPADVAAVDFISAPEDQERPAVASDGDGFLAVWMDRRNRQTSWTDYDIYGARISAEGGVLDADGINISGQPGWEAYPAVAFDGTNYLVVWWDDRDSTPQQHVFRLYAARVSRAGVVMDREGFKLSNHGVMSPPALAFNGTNYLVVATDWQPDATPSNLVYGVRVSPEGTVLDPRGFVIWPGCAHFPSVTAMAGDFLVAWSDSRVVQGARVSGTEAVSDPREFGPAGGYGWTAAATLGVEGWVVWTGSRTTNGVTTEDILGARVSREGTLLSQQVLGPNPAISAQHASAVAAGADGLLAVWHGGAVHTNGDFLTHLFDIRGAILAPDGQPAPVFTIKVEKQEQSYPRVAFNGSSFLVVWQDARRGPANQNAAAGFFDIYAARLSAAGEVVDPGGFLVSSSAVESVPPSIVVPPASQTVLVGQSVTFTVTVNGSTPLAYDWSFNGLPLPGATNETLTLNTVQAAQAGRYSVRVSSRGGSVTSPPATLTVWPPPTGPGSVDVSFDPTSAGWEGIVTVVRALAVQPDGRILVGGQFEQVQGVARLNLARLDREGKLDPSFDPGSSGDWLVSALLVEPDGKLLVGGFFTAFDGWSRPGIVRLEPDGSVDPGFVPHQDSAYPGIQCLGRQADGKVLIGGSFREFGGQERPGCARLNPDGSLDGSFVPRGYELDDGGIGAIVSLPEGNVLLGGDLMDELEGSRPTVLRLRSDGSRDASFRAEVGGWALALAGLSGGDVLVGGEVLVDGRFWGVVRLNPDGSVDRAFAPVAGGCRAMVPQPDGKVLALFASGELLRLLPDGAPDPSFRALIRPAQYLHALALQPDGRVLVGGDFSGVNFDVRADIVRLNNDTPWPFVRREIDAKRRTIRLIAAPTSPTSVYAVEDRPPVGWPVSGTSHGGIWDTRNQKVKFGPYADGEPRTLSYSVEPPDPFIGAVHFVGIGSADGVNTPVGGDARWVVGGRHPADSGPPEWVLSIAEVTAYGAAWRRGDSWSLPPHPIPIDYVTRAAALWRGGECYLFDDGRDAPLWWVNGDTMRRADFDFAPSPASSSPVAQRQLPRLIAPGEELTVTIATQPSGGVRAYAVEETVPTGWAISNISHGGELDVVNGQVKWGPFLDAVARDLSYRAVAAVGASEVGTFVGTASFDGAGLTVAGAGQVGIGSRLRIAIEAATGRLVLGLTGSQGRRYGIEISRDLVRWLALAEVMASPGETTLVLGVGPGEAQAFYRARLIP